MSNATQKQQLAADELKSLTDKFLASKGVAKSEDAKEANEKPNLLIGLPCYGGQMHVTCVNMLLSLTRLLTDAAIPHEFHFVCDSLISRARNQIASSALGLDSKGRKFDWLLFVDSDQSFDAGWVLKMLDTKLPLVGLICSRKVLNLAMMAEAAKKGVAPAQLLSFAGSPILAVDGSFEVSDKPVPVVHFGCGVMLISVEKVLRSLAVLHPERRYRPNVAYDKNIPENFDFFRCGVRGSTYLSEDFLFLEDVANDLGVKPHVIPAAVTFHVGPQVFENNMCALAAMHGALEQEQRNAAQPAGEMK